MKLFCENCKHYFVVLTLSERCQHFCEYGVDVMKVKDCSAFIYYSDDIPATETNTWEKKK